MGKKALIYKDNKSEKFWWIETLDNEFVINYGKIGTTGKYQLKDFDTTEDCQKEVLKLVNQKTKKGYVHAPDFDFQDRLYFDDEEMGLHPLTSHPNFRRHFKDELYYDCGDEEAPFGSDEGADTLALLSETVRKKGKIDFLNYPKHLIENDWGMKYIPAIACDKETVKELLATDQTNLIQSDMITYATAFAQIKITGSVSKALKEAGLQSMQRMMIVTKIKGYDFSGIMEEMITNLTSFDRYEE